jgi:hypothetical protein
MKLVVLVVYIGTHFVELIRVGRLLKRSGQYTPVFLFEWRYPTIEDDLAICRSEGFEALTSAAVSTAPAPVHTLSIRARFRAWVRRLYYERVSVRFVLGLLFDLRRSRSRLQAMRRHLADRRIAAVIFPEDNVEFGTPLLVRAAHSVDVPCVIVPFTVSTALEPAESLYYRPEFSASGHLPHRLVSRLYPHWSYTHRGHTMLRLEPHRILVAEWLGVAPPDPWTINSGATDAIAVESEYMRRHYVRAGLPSSRMVLTGALTDDVLAECLRHAREHRVALCKELGLSPDKPLLLCALPPSQFPRPCEFSDYGDLLTFWGESLAAIPGWNVIIRPHPRHGPDELRALVGCGLPIIWHDTARLVPICDLYVACVSATIRWAIACGKPVINYDAYHMHFDDYADFPGVVTVEKKAEFTSVLQELTGSSAAYADTAARQRERMELAARLDGLAERRMLELIDQVISDGPRAT